MYRILSKLDSRVTTIRARMKLEFVNKDSYIEHRWSRTMYIHKLAVFDFDKTLYIDKGWDENNFFFYDNTILKSILKL